MMIFILRGKCDCYLHVFPFMILSWCRQCLTYHEINFELNFTSLVGLAQQPRSADQQCDWSLDSRNSSAAFTRRERLYALYRTQAGRQEGLGMDWVEWMEVQRQYPRAFCVLSGNAHSQNLNWTSLTDIFTVCAWRMMVRYWSAGLAHSSQNDIGEAPF